MKIFAFTFLIFATFTSFGQNDSTSALTDTTSAVLPEPGWFKTFKNPKKHPYTKEFYKYDNNYSFKGIKFETNISIVSKLVQLKKTQFPNLFRMRNERFLTYSDFSFDRGYMSFLNGKLSEVLLSTSYRKQLFDEIIAKFSEVFGVPEKDGQDEYSWEGANLIIKLDIAKGKQEFEEDWITLTFFSRHLFSLNNQLENM